MLKEPHSSKTPAQLPQIIHLEIARPSYGHQSMAHPRLNFSGNKKMKTLNADKPNVSRRGFLSTTTAIGAGIILADAATNAAQGATLSSAQIVDLSRVSQEMVAPPFLPQHDQVAQGGPKIVEVRLVIDEKK